MIRAASTPQPAPDKLQQFVDKMRAAAPFGDIVWEGPMWDLTDIAARAGKRLHITTRNRLWFAEHRDTNSEEHRPFPSPFIDFAKAILCARQLRGAQTPSTHMVSLRALRYLFEAVALSGHCDPRRIEHAHLRLCEAAALKREKVSSAYRVGQRLEEIARLTDQHGIANAKLDYRSSIPKSDVEAISTKMPSQSALEALGDASGSAELYEREGDLILMRVVDLLVATGLRIGEVLTLPENPIVKKDGGIGLRYWPEKGSDVRVKVLASVQQELVQRAIIDLLSACAPARHVAKWCEANPGRVPLPEGLPEMLTSKDIELLGLSVEGASWLRSRKVKTSVVSRPGKPPTMHAARSEVEEALAGLREERPLLVTGDGQIQKLGESLIVVFLNQCHATRSINRFVSVGLTWGMLSDFLGGRDKHGCNSIFKRLELHDEDGKPHHLASHQFRHWLSTIGKRGGLSEVELARWMGRKRLADNRAYDHRTMDERTEEARRLIRSGRAQGPIADAYRSLPPADGETFLEAQVNGTLTTPYGLCVHDYGQGPCERHFNCAGCSELLRRKGDQAERTALATWLGKTRASLQSAKAEAAGATYGASNWVKCNERLEIDLIAMLAIDDGDRAEGELVQVWPNGHGPKGLDNA